MKIRLQSLRTVLFVFSFLLALCSPLYRHNNALAEREDRIDPKKITRDLDQKSSVLEEEEAKLLASLEEDNKPSASKSVEEDAQASIDIRKVAESIGDEVDTKPVAKQAPLVKVLPSTKAAVKKEPVKVIASDDFNQPQTQQIIKQEIVREIVKEADPELREEVNSLENLFSQWQNEFETKHARLLKSQNELASDIDARITILENSDRTQVSDEYNNLKAIQKELEQTQRSLKETQETLETRVTTLEKSDYEQQAAGSVSVTTGDPEKYSKLYNLQKKQEELLKALKLADGQIRHRMTTAEGQVSDAVNEVDGVKESLARLEGTLFELSDQFNESLKYKPHAVYAVQPEYVEEVDDVAYDWGKMQQGPRYTYLPHNAVMSNMPIVTVAEENANLWSGPEEDDKIVTTIKRGGQLAVEATEHDWYRVIIADGRRAWIPARSVIHNNPVGTGTALRIASASR
jgi:Bacterial SH3 domain